MIPEHRGEKAATLKRTGSANCCQSVLLAYADVLGKDEDALRRLGAGFAVGMGSMEATCGALIGAGMILGLKTADRDLSRSRMKERMARFQQRNGATQCKMLKGVGTGKVLRECRDCVADAAEFLEEQLRQG